MKLGLRNHIIWGVITSLVLTITTTTSVAAVNVDFTQNYTQDTNGSEATMHPGLTGGPFYNPSEDVVDNIWLDVPEQIRNGQYKVKSVTLEMHDHSEDGAYNLYFYDQNGNEFRIMGDADIKTNDEATCGRQVNYVQLNHFSHFSGREWVGFKTNADGTANDQGGDAHCYFPHTLVLAEIKGDNPKLFDPGNKIVTRARLKFECLEGSYGNNPDDDANDASNDCANYAGVHFHIRNVTWHTEGADQPPPPPTGAVCGKITLPNGNGVANQTVNIPTTNGPLSAVTDASGFFTTAPTIQKNVLYNVEPVPFGTPPTGFLNPPRTTTTGFSWNWNANGDTPLNSTSYGGQRMLGDYRNDCSGPDSNGKICRCNFVYRPATDSQPTPKPPTATSTVSCNPLDQSSSGWLGYTYTINNINTYGQPFDKANIKLRFNASSSQGQSLRNFLGTPDFTSASGAVEYTLVGTTTAPASLSSGNLSFTWNNNTRIGQQGAGRTINELVAELDNPTTYPTIEKSLRVVTYVRSAPTQPLPNGVDALWSNALYSKLTPDACRTPEQTAQCIAPPVPNITQPTNNGEPLVADASGKVTIAFELSQPDADNLLTHYEVLIYDQTAYNTVETALQAARNGKPNSRIVSVARTAADSGIIPKTYRPTLTYLKAIGSDLRIAVRAVNNTPDCANMEVSQWKPVDPPPFKASLTGQFFEVDNSCTLIAPVNLNSPAISARNQANQTINSGISYTSTGYSIEGLPESPNLYTLTLNFAPTSLNGENLVCAACNGQTVTASNTCVRPDIPTNSLAGHFFVQKQSSVHGSWWQARGGLVYGRNSLKSNLPLEETGGSFQKNATCASQPGICEPFLVRQGLLPGGELEDSRAESAGLPLSFTGLGNFITAAGFARQSINSFAVNQAQDNPAGALREDYNFFKSKVPNFPDTSTISTTTIDQPDQLGSGMELSDGTRIHYLDGDLTFSPSTTWEVNGKHVIFANGDIKFRSGAGQLTDVDQGEFVAFISNNTIIFDGSVGNTVLNSLTPNVEGVFIANNLSVQDSSDDRRFVGAGTFVGWSGVSLSRTFKLNQSENATTPTETFIFRPDFISSAPTFMRQATLNWREVN